MNWLAKVVLTLLCYALLLFGILGDDLWLVVVGAFLAGSSTLKLGQEVFEHRAEMKAKKLL